MLITGQVERTTDFEQGMPTQQALIDGQWQPDPWIHDDQAIVMHLRGKGLVILTGCGHAGVINTIRHARRLTGVEPIHAVIGGFHLTGAIFEPLIAPDRRGAEGDPPAAACPSTARAGRRTWRSPRAARRLHPE